MTDIQNSLRKSRWDVRIMPVKYGYSCNYNALTALFHLLPESIRRHSTRVSIIAEILAMKDDSDDNFPHLVYLGGLYHHLGACTGFTQDKKDMPLMSEQALRQNIDDLQSEAHGDTETVIDAVRHYHERMDGSGYPDHLQGDKSPLAARLVGLADMLDKLLCENLTSPNGSADKAERFIQKSGIALFGADAIACFEKSRDKIYAMYLGYYDRIHDWCEE